MSGMVNTSDETLLELRSVAIGAAREAGDLLAGRMGQVEVAATKSSPTDVVTEMDRRSEALIRSRILAARPSDAILGEEGGLIGDNGDAPVLWVIDPLDGTVNYLYGLPDWAVSIAAEVEWPEGGEVGRVAGGEVGRVAGGEVGRVAGGEVGNRAGGGEVGKGVAGGEVGKGVAGGEVGKKITVGAVYVPVRDELFCAVRGHGAWLQAGQDQWKPLRCSPAVPLGQALIGTGFGYLAARRKVQGEVVAALLPRLRDIRRMGAASVDLCAVAAGRLDGFYERGLNYWDWAAGALIAEEAGAVVGGLDGRPVSESMAVAAGPGLFGPLAAALTALNPERDA